MANGHAQRIGGVAAGLAWQHQQAGHHFLDLGLAGAAVADHCDLQLQRGVFEYRQAVADQPADRCAAGLAEQQCGLWVDVDENLFNRGAVGGIGAGDLADAVEKRLQPFRQALVAVALDRARGDVGKFVALFLDHAKAGGAQAGVDA
ncbi:hypothetical protein D3C81_1710940 [compost metagenome]